ncbi:MAG: HIT family protein [Thermoplasmata archaeon]|nr:HIT family protein [Thermoplasmata archaeon]
MTSCQFCDDNLPNLRTYAFYEDPCTLVFLAKEPQRDGHSIAILKANGEVHVESILDASPSQLASMSSALIWCSNLICSRLGAETVYVSTLCEGTRHLHFHLIPRYAYTEEDREAHRDIAGEEPVGPGFWYMAAGERFLRHEKYMKERIASLDDVLKKLKA